jgi:DNA recombination protein RmuC
MDILSLIVGFAAGALIAFVLAKLLFDRSRGLSKEDADRLHAEMSILQVEKGKGEARSALRDEQLARAEQDLAAERSALLHARSALAVAETDIKNAQEKLLGQKEQVRDLQDQFAAAFKNLANDILEEKSRKFTELNRDNLGALLTPLHEKIRDFETTISSTYASEVRERATLAEQIRHLTELNQQITREASNLTTALKGQSKTQGDWGELILEQILERFGSHQGDALSHPGILEGLEEDTAAGCGDSAAREQANHHRFKSADSAYRAYKAEDVQAQKEFLASMSIRCAGISECSATNATRISRACRVWILLMFVPLEPALRL